MSVHRIFEAEDAWQNGIYYARFGPNLNFGYSAPLFQFYPPLASYLGLVFRQFGLGYIAAAKAVLTFSLFCGCFGAYAYGRFLLGNRLAALVSGIIYLLSPYLLAVVYERGAVAEALAWGILPWLVWAAHRYYADGRRVYGLLLAAFVALAFLAHNATAMFIVPGVAFFIFLLAIIDHRIKSLLPVALAFLLGIGLSAFYWAPALAELRYTKTEEIMFRGATDASNNVVPLLQVVQHHWLHQFSGPERFRFALWQFVAGVIGVIHLALHRRQRPAALWLFASAWAVVLLLQVDVSRLFWQRVPLVDFIQFPWRLYGIASFCVTMLVGAIFMSASGAAGWRRWLWLAGASGLAAMVVWLSTSNMSPDKSPLWEQMDESEINRTALWERGLTGYPLFDDYTVTTVQTGSIGLARSRQADDPTILPATTAPQIEILAENPLRYVLNVNAPEPWTLRLHRPYFPGWQVYQNGNPAPTKAEGVAGLVTAALPAGEYQVVARLGDSPVRLAANLLSIVSLSIWLVWLFGNPRLWLNLLLVGLLSIALAAAIDFLTDDGKPSRQPTQFNAQFDNGLNLLAHHLPGNRLCIGDTTPLRLYWFADKTPPRDLKLFVHIATLDDSGKVAQFDNMPFEGYNPMTRWEAGELVVDEQRITLDSATPTGVYQLLIGLYDPVTVQNERVLGASTLLPGDRLRLTELELADCRQ